MSRTAGQDREARARKALKGALDGQTDAANQLVDAILPVVQSRVARALIRRPALVAGRDIQQEVEDLTQDVFAALFAKGARALKAQKLQSGDDLRALQFRVGRLLLPRLWRSVATGVG